MKRYLITLRACNARRRATRKAAGVCVDCGDPSPLRTHCAQCRAVKAIKDKGRKRDGKRKSRKSLYIAAQV